MKLSSRSYPHPVVGNGDDVPEYAFQATIDCELGPSGLVLDVKVQCSSPSLNRLLQKGAACYSIHVECGKTLFRRAYPFTTPTHRITIPAAELNAVVELTPFVVATRAIPRYEVAGANPVYAGATFAVQPGDVLAVGDPQDFHLAHDRDPFRQIGSIFKIERSTKSGDRALEAYYHEEKIRIVLCEADADAYGELKRAPHLRSLLATTLVLPVLVEAIHWLRDDAEACAGLKWADILGRKIDDLELGETEPLAAAQKILDLPIRRAFQSARSVFDTAD